MKRFIAYALVTCALLSPLVFLGCQATTDTAATSGSTVTIQVFTAAKSAEDVLKTAEKFRLAGKITDEQFTKVKAAYDGLREIEVLITEGKTGGTALALSTKAAELAAVAAEIGVAYGGE